MSTLWHSHMLAGAPAGEVAPPRWDDVWGDPLPAHPGRAWKAVNGRRAGDPRILSLYVHDDRHVLVGHGDWDANDGSTLLVALDPETGTYQTTGPHPAEAFLRFRSTSWGESLALNVDGTGYWEPMVPFATWPDRPVATLSGLHVFDAVEHDGLLWLSGSALNDRAQGVATTWWTADRGGTWNQVIVTGTPGDLERAHHLRVDDAGRLRVGLNSITTPQWASWYVWTGTEWEPDRWWPSDPGPLVCPYPVPPGGVVARTSTHWVLGTVSGDLYTRPIPVGH